ncbi:WXG100 family type VII secretion target [Nocardia niwae]|uniref:Outer membrane channel protein CpnT-like N-terminal domain-containing protein n=1 Tax=Nocardia niwae TaxID=626084 RepID=A0ABV2X595_9NOCA
MSGYENKRIPNGGEHTDSWEHSQINDTFKPLDPTDAFTQADTYWQARNEWERGVETFARSIQTSIAQAWSGPAAEQSKSAIAKYTGDAQNLTTSLEELYYRVRDAATAIADTKKAIPDLVDIPFEDRIFHPRRWNLSSERFLAEQSARVAMNEYYVQPFNEMDGKIPVLPTPVGPTASVDIPAPPPGGYQSDDDGGPTPNGPGTNPTATESGTSADENNDGQPEGTSAEEQQSTDEPAQDQQSSDTTADDTSTTPAGVDPTSTTPASTTDPAKTAPTTTPAPHNPGTPGSPGTPSTTSQPQPGRSVPGTPGTPNTSVNPAAAARATSGLRGTSGMPGMMAPGARGGGKDDESEHKTPDYLITQENTDELLGEPPRTLPGGVIGGTPD